MLEQLTARSSATLPQSQTESSETSKRVKLLGDFDAQEAALRPPPEPWDTPKSTDTSLVACQKLQPELAAQVDVWRNELADVAAKYDSLEVALATTSDPEQVKTLKAEKAGLETKRQALQGAIGKARADLEVLGNIGAEPAQRYVTPEQVSEILARRGQVPIGLQETTSKPGELSASRSGLDWKGPSTTTTMTTPGTTTTETSGRSSSVDLGAGKLTHAQTTGTSTTSSDQKSLSSTTRATTVGLGGASHTTTKEEVVGREKTVASSTVGFERGGGKMGVSKAASTSKTDASGATSDASSAAKGGVILGADQVGAYGGGEAAKGHTTQSGIKTGITTGADGRVKVCVTKVPDTNPTQYQIGLEIGVGGKVGGSVGYKKAASLSGSASGSATLSYSRRMSETEAARYLADVEAAQSGLAVPVPELAVIATGVSKGWDAAQAAAGSVAALQGDADAVKSMKEGEKIQLAFDGELAAKVGGSGESGGVSLGASAGVSASASLTGSAEIKRGKVVATIRVASGGGWSASGTGGFGAAGMSVGVAEKSGTSRTLVITIDPSRSDFAALYRDFMGCKSQEALLHFAEAHPDLVTKMRSGTSSEESTTGGASVAGLGVFGVSVTAGRSKEEIVDENGKEVTRYTGYNGVGGNFLLWKGSTTESLTMDVDEQNRATGDLSQTTVSNDLGASAEKLVDNLKKNPLSVATGAAKTEVERTHVAGYLMSNSDFESVMGQAHDERAWSSHVASPRLREDWMRLRIAIIEAKGDKHKVAAALTGFVGNKGHGRYEALETVVRAPDSGEGGIRDELPDGLGEVKALYKSMVQGNPVAGMRELASKRQFEQAIQAGEGALAALDTLMKRIEGARNDFKEPAAHSEMVRRVGARRVEVEVELKNIHAQMSGGTALTPGDLEYETAAAKFKQLLGLCQTNKALETTWFKKMSGPSQRHNMTGIVNQLRELYVQWEPAHAELSQLANLYDFDDEARVPSVKPDKARFSVAFTEVNGMAYYTDPYSEEASRAQDEADRRAGAQKEAEEGLSVYQHQRAENEAYVKQKQMQSEVMGAWTQWAGQVNAARSTAQNAAGKCNGMHAKGLSSSIKPDAKKAWSDGFQLLDKAGESYNYFEQAKQYCRDAQNVQRLAEKAISKYAEVKVKFMEGNALQG